MNGLTTCDVLGHDYKFVKCQVNTLTAFYPQEKQLSPNLKDEHTLRIEYMCHRCMARDIQYLDISKFIYNLAVETYAKPQDRWAESFDMDKWKKEHPKND